MEFCFCKDSVLGDQHHILFSKIRRQALSCGGEVAQATAGCFFLPFVRITVAAENDSQMVAEGCGNQFMQRVIKVLGLFQHIRKFAQFLRHDGVQNGIRIGNGLRGTQHTELEFITGEGKGRGTVAVRGILGMAGRTSTPIRRLRFSGLT